MVHKHTIKSPTPFKASLLIVQGCNISYKLVFRYINALVLLTEQVYSEYVCVCVCTCSIFSRSMTKAYRWVGVCQQDSFTLSCTTQNDVTACITPVWLTDCHFSGWHNTFSHPDQTWVCPQEKKSSHKHDTWCRHIAKRLDCIWAISLLQTRKVSNYFLFVPLTLATCFTELDMLHSTYMPP